MSEKGVRRKGVCGADPFLVNKATVSPRVASPALRPCGGRSAGVQLEVSNNGVLDKRHVSKKGVRRKRVCGES